MTKGSKSDAVSGANKEKAMVEKKGKRSQFCTRVDMNFNPNTTELHKQEEVDEYLAKYGIRLSPEIKVEFCP